MPIPAAPYAKADKANREPARRKACPAEPQIYARFERERLFQRMTRAAGFVGVIALWVFAVYLVMLLRHV
jgi:hypothetical protein